jgi:hypothetical protein
MNRIKKKVRMDDGVLKNEEVVPLRKSINNQTPSQLVQKRSKNSLQKIDWQKRMLKEKMKNEKKERNIREKNNEKMLERKKEEIMKLKKKTVFKNGDDLFNYFAKDK